MTLKLHVIHAKDFVKLTTNGELDFDASRELLIEVASVDTPASELDILIDFRKSRAILSTTDIWYLAAEFEKHRTIFREKIALLISPEGNFDKAKFFELCATNRGFDVRAFMIYEEAIDWLFPSSEVSNRDPSR